MKKKNLKSFRLNKKTISNMQPTNIRGGLVGFIEANQSNTCLPPTSFKVSCECTMECTL